MAKRMLIDALHAEETRVAIADESQIYDFDFVSTAKKQLKGNIYLAKITRVEPSLQAAFVEYGGGKQGFLPFAEIHSDYYQIPISDRIKLMEEMAREIENASSIDDAIDAVATSVSETEHAAETQEADFTTENQTTSEEIKAGEEAERPAYLTQGAIDISISETLPFVELSNELAPAIETIEIPTQTAEQSENISDNSSDNSALNSNETSGDAAVNNVEAADEAVENVETVETAAIASNDSDIAPNDEERENRHKRNLFMRRYKIQEVIRRGQIVLIQVIKEERGNKGVSVTTYLSLAGRYCVLMPNSPKDGGISRKIASAEDRKRLKAISTEFRLAEGMSVIIRTAGMDRTRAEIKRDFDYLVNLWNAIREDTLKSNAPALIYEEGDIIKRAIRDQYSNDIDEVIVEGETGFKSAREFMKLLSPSHVAKIKQHTSPTPLFYTYGIEEQLLSMHEPVVKMKSGAYLVINPTEALISIDVNSGKATGERNIEETALRTNLDAAAEVARQLRLRDLAGLVVIDFIDMMESRNRRAVEKMLKDSLKNDRAKIQLGRISPFGLLEMSRQRLRPSISETSMSECPHCLGRGIIRSNESMAIQVIRAIEKEAGSGNAVTIRVIAPQTIALYMLNSKRDALRELENRYSVTIQILINTELTASEFNIEKIRKSQGGERTERADRPERNDNDRRPPRRERPERQERAERQDRQRNVETTASEPEIAGGEAVATEASEGEGARRNRRPRRRGGRGRDARPNNNGTVENQNSDNVIDFPQENPETSEAKPQEENRQPRERAQERTDRGRRKWRDRGDAATAETKADDAPTRWDGGAAAMVDGAVLPAFATDARPAAIPAPPTYKPFHDHKPETVAQSTEPAKSEPASPPKRGWWQKMISLDD